MSGATQNHALVGSSSGFIVINETAVYISKWGRWGILGWRHSPKMVDAEMCVPVSIGFGKTALVPARIEYSAWQMCVRERKHSTSTCGISTSGTWLPGEVSATDAGPWMDHDTWDCLLESDGTGANIMSRATAEALHMGLGRNPWGPAANVNSLEPQHQRYHEEPHKPMDRGDCQGSLHSSWSSVWKVGENLVNDGRMWCSAQVRLRKDVREDSNFFVWNFAWDRLASRLYAATATPFRTWRYQLIIRYF